MEAEILRVFVQGAARYFNKVGVGDVLIHPPYLETPETVPAESFSAAIGISGRYRGWVYFTAPKGMLAAVLTHMGESPDEARLYPDVVGEICNTISGNARAELGPGFMISVPLLFSGNPSTLSFPKGVDCYVIPIEWSGQRAKLVVAIRSEVEAMT